MSTGNFKITVEDKSDFLYMVELKKGRKEKAVEVRFGASIYNQNDMVRQRIIASYDVVCDNIVDENFVSFLREKLELSSRVKSIVLTLSKLEWIIQHYKGIKKSAS
jgi:hypothetical protein